MELGGKAPLVVTPSANLDLVVNNLIFSFTLHSGQICMATNNVIVHESIADDVLAKLKNATDQLSASPDSPMRRGLFNERSADRARGLLQDALDKGAKVLSGRPQENKGNLVQPTVIDNLSDDMRALTVSQNSSKQYVGGDEGLTKCLQEEHFAPFVNILRYKDNAQAIQVRTITSSVAEEYLIKRADGQQSRLWPGSSRLRRRKRSTSDHEIHRGGSSALQWIDYP